MKHWNQVRERGDTLVEVLIAISVVSLILGGAYVTTNRSLLATRAAEERGNALKLAESQVEQLKGLAKSDPDAIFGAGTPSPFCIAGQPGAVVIGTSAECRVDAAGQPTGTEPIYELSIIRGSDGNTFTVVNEWTDPSGQIVDNLQLIYRVYD